MWLTDEQMKYLISAVAVVLVLVLLHKCMCSERSAVPQRRYNPSGMDMRRMMMNSYEDRGRNLNDMVVEMRAPVPDRYPVNTTSCRWMSEAFVSGKADEEQFEHNPNVVQLPDPTNAIDIYGGVVSNFGDSKIEADSILLTRASELLGADIITPMKLNLNEICNSTSQQQLLNMNNEPEFTPNTSSMVTM